LNFNERGFVERECQSSPTQDWDPFHAHPSQYPLLEYASVCWFHHFVYATDLGHLNSAHEHQADIIVIDGLTRESALSLSIFLSSEILMVKWLEVFHHFKCNGRPLAANVDDPISEWIESCQDKDIEVSISPTPDGNFYNEAEGNTVPDEQSLAKEISNFVSHLGRCNVRGVQRWLRWLNAERHTRTPIFIAASFDFHNFVENELVNGTSTEAIALVGQGPRGNMGREHEGLREDSGGDKWYHRLDFICKGYPLDGQRRLDIRQTRKVVG
jgi:hypothetical protein